MRYYLDSNAWIHLSNYPDVALKVAQAAKSGSINICISRANLFELTEDPKITEANLAANKSVLALFEVQLQADSIFILGRGIMGETLFSSSDSEALFSGHLNNKGNPLKAVPDGIHLVNAHTLRATLVTCDKQARKTATEENLIVICLWEFLEFNSLPTKPGSICSACNRWDKLPNSH